MTAMAFPITIIAAGGGHATAIANIVDQYLPLISQYQPLISGDLVVHEQLTISNYLLVVNQPISG